MARLQILELPMVHNGDQTETPFILVIDDWTVDTMEERAAINAYWDDFAQKIGARGVLCSDRTIDIPANDLTLPSTDSHDQGDSDTTPIQEDLFRKITAKAGE
ncbi:MULTISPECIES: hypothetical protein [unclassified Streptomyces]|uniref:hypothetical protein n=1 Tax=unclassified Streptomyces TaxID=2593676 RepID=UPI00278C7176|nr:MULTISPECIES: hypothetical protein [unclassified Streptomyces]